MKVLADFHHAGLLHSLIMLFEDRLGGEVYRPIGMEWADEGFWAVYDHPATRAQYLSLDQGFRPPDGTPPLNKIKKVMPGTFYCQDIDSGYYNKAITLNTFKNTKFDIVIASMPQHIEPFKRLIAEYNPTAKLIFQVGNQWDGVDAPNIMASAKLSNVPPAINYIEYHQEFDLKDFNELDREVENYTIGSFMNVPEQFPDYENLLMLEKSLDPKWKVFIHGGLGRDGAVHGSHNVAKIMRSMQWVWQVKAGGDGYGHILFNSAACGVPTIVKKSYYAGKLGEKLLIPDVTCIDIDNLNVFEIITKLEKFSAPDAYRMMSENVVNNFRDFVNFDEEQKQIEAFLERLK